MHSGARSPLVIQNQGHIRGVPPICPVPREGRGSVTVYSASGQRPGAALLRTMSTYCSEQRACAFNPRVEPVHCLVASLDDVGLHSSHHCVHPSGGIAAGSMLPTSATCYCMSKGKALRLRAHKVHTLQKSMPPSVACFLGFLHPIPGHCSCWQFIAKHSFWPHQCFTEVVYQPGVALPSSQAL